ncbi:MAG: hypothetical protein ABIF71_02460 [Planctomycetota bacterium]
MMTGRKTHLDKLVEIQNRTKFSNIELARCIGVHPMTISKYFTHKAVPDSAVRQRIDGAHAIFERMNQESWFKRLLLFGGLAGLIWAMLNNLDDKQ